MQVKLDTCEEAFDGGRLHFAGLKTVNQKSTYNGNTYRKNCNRERGAKCGEIRPCRVIQF